MNSPKAFTPLIVTLSSFSLLAAIGCNSCLMEASALEQKDIHFLNTPKSSNSVGNEIAPAPASPPLVAQAIAIKKVNVIGSTLSDNADFSSEIAKISATLEGKQVSAAEIQKAARSISQLYADRGYTTSRAEVDSNQIVDGVVTIRVIEGRIEKIEIQGLNNTNPDYVRSRLELGVGIPANTAKIEDQLRLLRADPIFKNVEASLKAGSQPDSSILSVKVEESNQFGGFGSFDNYSPPAVGAERLGVGLLYRNVTGNGDTLSAAYYRTTTGGSNQYSFSYNLPLNPMNGTLTLQYSPSNFRITQTPFDVFNINGNNAQYDVSFRQPLWRSSIEEFALTLGYNYQNGQTFSFNDLATPFGTGPDANGVSRTSVVRFGQDYTLRDLSGTWALRSQFNLGTGLFGSTYVTTPSGSFFSWLGQVQRLQVLGTDSLLIASLDAQLSADPLLPSQQFIIGGGQSLRGFRQNARSGDNGIRFSLENRNTIVRNDQGAPVLQIIPFLDAGGVWNNAKNPNTLPAQNFLAGGGVGFLYTPVERLNLRLDFAIPFVNLSDRGTNVQEQSLYFSLGYQF
ncbi:ShlB/FhaC/HecB family hemolysin secretion/activation protein [Pseudanabaena sp. UWO310]|uniref:ShlB/FhaC/HecB family hemolysin secretion/activation protein n=1 Tax=Pseudanabaena sp. UWO310 TaxID=2480795 RepID=UPI0011611113|nr:ShlB/FhaC/HecB family hemolysin secretion/activation protein [Pseudanabaena sp. UWO310]TYQ23866.1 ShlB/FhaC/HecB family hemolysin secretion/activation protein [Pseudanabaena sp. UWO310]